MFHGFDLYLFDFDGLLVNTEEMHLEAYRHACRAVNVSLEWTFDDFCRHAHYSATGIREALSKVVPDFGSDDSLWSTFYQCKSAAYLSFLKDGKVGLMPGVETFLAALQNKGSRICVVTHSKRAMIELIRERHPTLQKIHNWITREDYAEAKPSADSYLAAMRNYLKPGGRAIGFEDSPRGLNALIASGAEAVWITQVNYPEVEEKRRAGILVYPSFIALLGSRHA